LEISNLHLEEYAHSLGLPNIPGDLNKVLQNVSTRDDVRTTKNVNRKLQKLKEQIRLEKEEKKKKRKRREESKSKQDDEEADEDAENELLVVKARHEATNLDEVDSIPLASAKARKPKKIRIDGGNSNDNKHIIFEEDGTVQPRIFEAKHNSDDDSDVESLDDEEVAEALKGANDGYLEKVRERLNRTKDLDKEEERERIRAKHRKKRMKEKDELSNEVGGSNETATLAVNEMSKLESGHGDDGSISNSSSSESSSEGSSNNRYKRDIDSDSEDSNSVMDVTKQEDLALSLIRGI
jgi:ATP-dependent RNA helicase DDX10/DBP4